MQYIFHFYYIISYIEMWLSYATFKSISWLGSSVHTPIISFLDVTSSVPCWISFFELQTFQISSSIVLMWSRKMFSVLLNTKDWLSYAIFIPFKKWVSQILPPKYCCWIWYFSLMLEFLAQTANLFCLCHQFDLQKLLKFFLSKNIIKNISRLEFPRVCPQYIAVWCNIFFTCWISYLNHKYFLFHAIIVIYSKYTFEHWRLAEICHIQVQMKKIAYKTTMDDLLHMVTSVKALYDTTFPKLLPHL